MEAEATDACIATLRFVITQIKAAAQMMQSPVHNFEKTCLDGVHIYGIAWLVLIRQLVLVELQ